ncbi:MAG: PIN domain-containing protein [Clostridiales bacterium]|jgi:predicted nucleic acid-binding protein|nr:PIN domain-containing protein [Clostridiales bacterium]
MILVDTSVMINYLKGSDNEKTRLFDRIIERDIPFGISVYTYQEVLQGARDDKEFQSLKQYLSSQKIYILPNTLTCYEQAAKLFFDLRRKGRTIRSAIDALIAQTAIHYRISLLHNDRDFDDMAEALESLRILKEL